MGRGRCYYMDGKCRFFFKIVGSQMLATSIIFLSLLKPTTKIITIMELWMQLVVARFVQLEYSAIG